MNFREWMINEKLYSKVPTEKGQTDLYVNPSLNEIKSLLDTKDEVSGLAVGNDLFVWGDEGYYGLRHIYAIKFLKEKGVIANEANVVPFYIRTSQKQPLKIPPQESAKGNMVWATVATITSDDLGKNLTLTRKQLKNHPFLSRLLDKLNNLYKQLPSSEIKRRRATIPPEELSKATTAKTKSMEIEKMHPYYRSRTFPFGDWHNHANHS